MTPVLQGGEFNVDTTAITKYAFQLKGSNVQHIVGGELAKAGQRSGRIVLTKANALTNRRTGQLIDTSTSQTAVSASTITTTVKWPAKSKQGFNYPYIVNYGRGPVFAKPGGVLRFEVGGKILFRKSVGAAKAQHFAEKGLEAAIPGIVGEHERANAAIVQRIEKL
jgi:hypothetical protein